MKALGEAMLTMLPSRAKNRATGITAIGDVPWGSHFCHFYRTAQDIAEVLVPFFTRGLQDNERCLWVTCEPLAANEARALLRAALADYESYEARGQIEILDYSDWYTRGGGFSAAEVLDGWLLREAAALRDGYDGLRISANVNWLSRGDFHAFVEYEGRAHNAFEKRRLLALCSYSLERCTVTELLDVLGNHSLALVRDAQHWSVIRSATQLIAHVANDVGTHEVEKAYEAPRVVSPRSSPLRLHGHDAHFYADGAFPARKVASYLADGLAHGGGAVAIATHEHLHAIRGQLVQLGIDVDGCLAGGQLMFMEAREAFKAISRADTLHLEHVQTILGPLVRAIDEAFPTTYVFGELVDIFCTEGRFEDALLIEQWWNEQLEKLNLSLLCVYRLANFAKGSATTTFNELCKAHDDVQARPATSDVDGERLLALFEQRTRALDSEIQRNLSLEAERAQLREAERWALSRAEAAHRHVVRLQRATAALSEANTVEEVCAVLHSDMLDAVGAADGAVAVLNAETGELTTFTERTRTVALCEAAIREGPVCVSSLDDLENVREWTGATQVVYALALPLALGPKRLGAVLFEFPAPCVLGLAQRGLLQDFARQLALALDRTLTHERAEQALARAEESNRAKDAFLALLGHELRNPLAPMLTALHLMQERDPTAFVHERAVLERQLNHMVRLVDDLLDASRISRGSFELSRRPVELQEVVSSSVEMVSPLIESRHHHLTVDMPERSILLHADPFRLSQVVSNLLTNAAKYTSQGGRIELTAKVRGEEVELTVRDNGSGLEPDLLPSIFDMFVQGKQGLDRRRGGLGLGLWIAKTLVELHGGKIRAESPGKGQGSTFTIVLPCASTQLASVKAPPRESRKMERVRPLRILVVDDNADAGETLADMLTEFGHTTRVARDGFEALGVAEQFAPEFALLDIGLPAMDGYELAAQLKRRLGPRTPQLIALTGYGQPSDQARAQAAGFSAHLTKPVRPETLVEMLAKLRRSNSSQLVGMGAQPSTSST